MRNSWWWRVSWRLEPFYRYMAGVLVRVLYRIRFVGFEAIPEKGPALLIANHVSYVDGLILQAACKRPVRFIIDKHIYQLPVVHYFMSLSRAIPVLPKKDDVTKALQAVSSALEAGEIVCIFPEGQLTFTGHLGRFRPGIEWIIEHDPVPIYPVALAGLWGSVFSRKYVKAKYRWLPRSFRRSVTAVCGSVIHPDSVKVTRLQQVIMGLLKRV